MKKRIFAIIAAIATTFALLTPAAFGGHYLTDNNRDAKMHWHEDEVELVSCSGGLGLRYHTNRAAGAWNNGLNNVKWRVWSYDRCNNKYVNVRVRWSPRAIDNQCNADPDEDLLGCMKVTDGRWHNNHWQITEAVIWIGKGRWSNLRDREKDILMVHELGHAFFLAHWNHGPHSGGHYSIMYDGMRQPARMHSHSFDAIDRLHRSQHRG